jgi:hypothetical protein
MITQKTLLKWRGKALVAQTQDLPQLFRQANQTILRLTQEALDQQLLKKEKENSDV